MARHSPEAIAAKLSQQIGRPGNAPLPAPPDDMPEAAAALWRTVLASMPADHFERSDLPLLAAYCQTRAIAADIYAEIAAGADRAEALKDLDRVEGIASRQARQLRIHPQHRHGSGRADQRASPTGATSGGYHLEHRFDDPAAEIDFHRQQAAEMFGANGKANDHGHD